MDERYLRYYDRYTWRAAPRFLFDALRTRGRLRRLSLLNRYRDYLRLADQPELLALHRQLNVHLLDAAREWSSYDYGEGYFYQSCRPVGITGLRDTEARVREMNLPALLAGRRVLEIGCNSGFLTVALAAFAREVTGIELNPYLVQIGRDVASHLGIANLQLDVCGFEAFAGAGQYDAVLSFANHQTYDGNTRQSVEQYFARCRDLAAPGGLFLFESHAPDYEREGAERVLELIRGLFKVQEERQLQAGTFLDRRRTFIVAKKQS